MDLSQEERSNLARIANDILRALEDVAAAAQVALSPPGSTEFAFATMDNPMVGATGEPQRNLTRIQGDVRRYVERVLREPFVSRVHLRWEGGEEETLYVTRGSAVGLGGPRKLASQATPKGALAALDPGDTGILAGREYEILDRVDIRPEHREVWDAFDDQFWVGPLYATMASLRSFLSAPEAAIPEDVVDAILGAANDLALVHEKLRRRVIARMSLRDQPTLDRHQDEVSRLPLEDRVLLLGPPGSGKTTTLIRRLAHKRHPEGLDEAERATLDATGLRGAFDRSAGWVMFSPTDLLGLYLRDAFNREQVPAEASNLRTWDRERRDLGRNVLRILRTESDGPGFTLDEDARFLKDESSKALAALHDAFVHFSSGRVAERVGTALKKLLESDDPAVASAAKRLRDRLELPQGLPTLRDLGLLLENANLLTPELARVRKSVEEEVKRTVNALIGRRDSPLMKELVAALPKLRGTVSTSPEDDEEEEEEEEEEPAARNPEQEALGILLSGLRARARQIATGHTNRPSARVARLLEVIGARMPAENELQSLGKRLLLIAEMRIVQSAPRRLVLGLPSLYGSFRRTADAAQWFQEDAGDRIRARRISPNEVDLIILAMLGVARQLMDLDRRRYSSVVPDWLDAIRRRYVPQVLVDEATDFSSVQLAAMVELAHPQLRSWFACGDFRQRITASGVQSVDELAWIARTTGLAEVVRSRDVTIGYRQSPRLRALAAALEDMQDSSGGKAGVAPDADFENDVWPLLSERRSGPDLAEWIGARIAEIGRTVKPLPSIAIFVDGEARVDETVKLLVPVLAQQNLPVIACSSGRDIGDRAEIRVFDVQHIKGLEFEAVFFVGIDVLAERLPALFDRYLYVGVTRAATYLCVACETSLPPTLEPLRNHLSNNGWE